jgi:putative ABC transport system permease protein
VSTLFADLRYSLRSLRATPGFTATVVVVLALGIGANTAMFTAIDAAFLRPLPFPEPERLVELNEQPPGSSYFMSVSYPNFLDWERQQDVFESIGIAAAYGETLLGAGAAERVEVGYISAGFLRAFRVRPITGREFTADDDKPSAAPVAILTTAFWQSHYGADPNIIGRKLTSDGQVFTIIGVLPPFPWYYRSTAFFAPIALVADKQFLNMRENHNGPIGVARLKPGVTIEQARAQMHAIARRLSLQYPGSNGNVDAYVRPSRPSRPADASFRVAALRLSDRSPVDRLCECCGSAARAFRRSPP